MMFTRPHDAEETKWEDIPDQMLSDDLYRLTQRLKEVVIDNPLRIVMDIKEFESKWLTYFICKVEGDKPNIPITNWIIEVTGNPYTWVDVVKNGEVQYSVPPLLNSKAVKVTDGNFYHHIMEIQAMVDHGHPKHEIEAYREKNLLSLISKDEGADTFIAEINKIAMYYGYKPFTNDLPNGESFKEEKSDKSEGFSDKVIRIDEF